MHIERERDTQHVRSGNVGCIGRVDSFLQNGARGEDALGLLVGRFRVELAVRSKRQFGRREGTAPRELRCSADVACVLGDQGGACVRERNILIDPHVPLRGADDSCWSF